MRNLPSMLLYLFVLVLIMPWCIADLSISVSSYDPVSKLAKLKVANTDQIAYSELKISIDGSMAVMVVNQLNAGGSALTPQIVEPGTHNVILTTKEGKTVAKSLNFAKTEEQAQQEVNQTEELSKLREEELENRSAQTQERLDEEILKELENINKTEEVRSQVEKQTQMSKPKTEGSFLKKYYLYGITAFAVILILVLAYLFLIKKFLLKKNEPEPKEKLAGTVTPPTFEPAKEPILKNFEKHPETPVEERNEPEKQIRPVSQQAIQKPEEEPGCRTHKTVEEQKPLERKRPLLTRDVSSLVDYFINLIGDGYSQEQMISMALSVGWKKEEIEEALREAEIRRGSMAR